MQFGHARFRSKKEPKIEAKVLNDRFYDCVHENACFSDYSQFSNQCYIINVITQCYIINVITELIVLDPLTLTLTGKGNGLSVSLLLSLSLSLSLLLSLYFSISLTLSQNSASLSIYFCSLPIHSLFHPSLSLSLSLFYLPPSVSFAISSYLLDKVFIHGRKGIYEVPRKVNKCFAFVNNYFLTEMIFGEKKK
jgi:hypothetical protein